MTSSRWLTAAAIATLAVGCGTPGSHTGTTGDDTVEAPEGHGYLPPPPPPPPPPSTCRALGSPGTVVSAQDIAGGKLVAVDAHGNVFYTADQGIVKQTSDGARVYAFPFGSVLAVDGDGNAFVAGSFTQPIDLGATRLYPNGNIDVFVAELSPRGTVVFAVALGLCGDGVESIAVAHDGRIAVAGDAMGTAILDPWGKLLELLPYAGQLAFDSHGNLYVAGSFVGSLELDRYHVLRAGSATDTDAFLAEVDVHANLVRSLQLGDAPLPVDAPDETITTPRPQTLDGIAIDAHDEIALLGTFQSEMLLFGQVVVQPSHLPSGTALATFAAKLDGGCAPVFARVLALHYQFNPPGGIAIDATGTVLVSTNFTSEAFFPFAFPQLFSLDAVTGATRWQFSTGADEPRGFGLGVAADPCGNPWWADTEHGSPIVPLQPVLRHLAR